MADRVVHFEIPADDVERARRFYREAFGWSTHSSPGMPYTLLGTTPTDPKTMRPKVPGGINGGMLRRQAPIESLVITVEVDDLEDRLRRVAALGGTVLLGKREVPGVGYTAYVRDSECNTVGLLQPLRLG